MASTTTFRAGPKLWVPGDWNALFGFGTNILVNLLVLTGLLQFVLKMPPELIFGRILPATGLMMFLSTGYYAWLAYSYARKTGRDDVCALPSGIIGCLMGNPFINAVYIGHPGWKAMGGRIGYSFATGIMVIALCWFGIISVMLALVPVVAISPILLYIGMLIGAQAFQSTPSSHAPAVVLAILPSIAAWALTMINGALGAAGVQVTPDLITAMAGNGVLYQGLHVLGGGAILSGLILASIAVFIIERKLETAAIFAAVGATLTFFGFMHGEAIGFNVTPLVALAYLMLAGFLLLCSRLDATAVTDENALLDAAQQPAE